MLEEGRNSHKKLDALSWSNHEMWQRISCLKKFILSWIVAKTFEPSWILKSPWPISFPNLPFLFFNLQQFSHSCWAPNGFENLMEQTFMTIHPPLEIDSHNAGTMSNRNWNLEKKSKHGFYDLLCWGQFLRDFIHGLNWLAMSPVLNEDLQIFSGRSVYTLVAASASPIAMKRLSLRPTRMDRYGAELYFNFTPH